MPVGAAFAANVEDVQARIEALEKENETIRRENAALKANQALREQNAKLKSELGLAAGRSALQPSSKPSLANSTAAKSADVFAAYAADLPVAYKAAPDDRGLFRAWGEGGGIFTGGDPSLLPFDVITGLSSNTQYFDTTPKFGWEVAGGFDYRFVGSPWHVSGQLRYGEGKGPGLASSTAAALDASIFGSNSEISGINESDSTTGSGRERHWLADIAVGRDVLGSGSSAMQAKVGLRVSEFRATTTSLDNFAFGYTFSTPQMFGGVPYSALNVATTTDTMQQARFLGAGPRFGIEGSVPLPGQFAFDYMGDVAVLFGKKSYSQVYGTTVVATPAFFSEFVGDSAPSNTYTEKFATVLNADLQFGVSYWFNPALKMTASYRLDAYFNALSSFSPSGTVQSMDRYIHGPRLGVSGQF